MGVIVCILWAGGLAPLCAYGVADLDTNVGGRSRVVLERETENESV